MYLNKIVFNHRSFVSIHWELLREESDCKAVSHDKGSCRVLHCSSSAPEENKNRVFEAYSFEAGIYRVLSLKHLLKTTYKVSPMGNGSAATWLLESQIYYNNQTLNGDVLVVGIEI
ncbi:hypothetical protein ACFX15_000931 [Malus domestica]